MTVPATIRAGDTAQWIEPPQVDLDGNVATSAAWSFVSYLRFPKASEAATVTGTARSDGGWLMSISATTTAGFDAGLWSWQSRITSGAVVITVGSGSFETLPNLSYAGAAASFDGRSQAQQDLDAVELAIRTLVSKGAKSYTIGSRSFTSQDLSELIKWRADLRAIVARETVAEKIAAGLGNPHNLFVRFS
jgi:hypothetical protein